MSQAESSCFCSFHTSRWACQSCAEGGRSLALWLARWRMPPEELLGVAGLSSPLLSGKMALPGTERTMRTRTRKAEEDEEVTSNTSYEAMAEYSAQMRFVWNVEQPARVRRGGGFAAPENCRQLADQTDGTDCLCLAFVTARTSRSPRYWHTLFPLSCRHNSQA